MALLFHGSRLSIVASTRRLSSVLRISNEIIAPKQIPNKYNITRGVGVTNRKCTENAPFRCLATSTLSSSKHETAINNDDDSEKSSELGNKAGGKEKREFKAETRMLLDIVATSLYSESEIFIRELISNGSDALEKFRYLQMSNETLDRGDRHLQILLRTDKLGRTFTIHDTGIGMSKEEMIENLGTIAKSGSKMFRDELLQKGVAGDSSAIIGQFGVGFYSAFMVANRVEVFSRSGRPGSTGYKWTSDGTGSYEIEAAEDVDIGTKIVVHLKPECRQFADEETVKGIVMKYSNFVGSPILLNGTQINQVEAQWLKDPKTVDGQNHVDFYKFVSGSYDRPRFVLHFATDAPINLRCLLYIPDKKPGSFELSREAEIGVALYSRKILIKNKADNIIPRWLRFLVGVVDSEDIPLNLSRELLQEGAVIRKLKTVVVNRILRFLQEKAQKEPEEYAKFYKDYGVFLKEGIVTEQEQLHKEEISRLLRFESSKKPTGEGISLPEYLSRMQPAQKDVYYLAAPSRELAERSPYLEALRERDFEVLFCFEPYDEVVLLQLRQYDGKPLTSVEKEMRQMKEDLNINSLPIGSITESQAESLRGWLQNVLKGRAHTVKLTKKLESHPCVVTVEEMGAARHFIRTQTSQLSSEARYSLLQPRLEINVKHPLIKKLVTLKDSDPDLAVLVADQLFAMGMVIAGLEDDASKMVTGLNNLLTRALEKH